MDKTVEYTMNFERALALHGLGLFLYFFDFRHETAGLFDYNGFGGRFKYLTFIIKIVSVGYLILCTLNDLHALFTNVRRTNQLHQTFSFRFISYIEACVLAPFTTYVVVVYWGMRLGFGEATIEVDAVVPAAWGQFVSHVFPVLLALLDKIFIFHKYPGRNVGIITVILVHCTYGLWIVYLGIQHNIWVYPFIQDLSVAGKFLFFFGSSLLSVVFYFLGEATTHVIWSM